MLANYVDPHHCILSDALIHVYNYLRLVFSSSFFFKNYNYMYLHLPIR